jgi:transposase
MRMKENWWLNVKEFSESGRKQQVVSFRLPKKDRELLKDYPWMYEKLIKCRLVRLSLPNGEKEILCTSLMDSRKYPIEDIAELYHYRWNEEEGYKLFKSRMEVENFSGKTALAVKQDFFAKVFIMSLCADLAFPIEEKVKKEYEQEKGLKHQQKINRTNALSMTRDICIGLIIKRLIKKALKAFDKIVKGTREIIRPDRKNVRKSHLKRLYHMNYKRL